MYDKRQYYECWAYCEYFLDHAGSGILLSAFDLVREAFSSQTTRDAYVYERITRPVLARYYKEVKAIAGTLVADDRLGEAEITAKDLVEQIKADFFSSISKRLHTLTVREFESRMTDGDSPGTLMLMVSLYYACHLNRDIAGAWAHPFYFRVFPPFLVKSRKNGFRKAEKWQMALINRFLAAWSQNRGQPDTLRLFFEHKTTRKIIAFVFAGILGFIRDDPGKALYLFQVVNELSSGHLAVFQAQMANGLNTSLEKKKRVPPKPLKSGEIRRPPVVGILTESQIMAVIHAVVGRYVDEALDWSIQHCLAEDKKKAGFAKRYDKTFLMMNRCLWQEMLALAETRKRVVFRTRHLLRIMIHHMFETRDIDRDFWQKYIPSVDNVIRYTYRDAPRTLQRLSAILNKQIRGYRRTRKYQDTDWAGFYGDPKCMAVAGQVLRDVRARAAGAGKTPAVWFSTQVETGVDYQVLYRFFRQTRIPA